MSLGEIGVEAQRLFQRDLCVLVQSRFLGDGREVERLDAEGASKLCVGRCVGRVHGNRLLQQLDRRIVVLAIFAPDVHLTTQIEIVGGRARCLRAARRRPSSRLRPPDIAGGPHGNRNERSSNRHAHRQSWHGFRIALAGGATVRR